MPNTRMIMLTDRRTYILLDVNPQEVTVNYANDVKSYDLVDGEYVHSTKPKAIRVSVSTFIPHDGSDFCQGAMSQLQIVNMMERWRDLDAPVYLYLENIISQRFLIENFSKRVREGDQDIFITLDLAEQRDIKITGATDNYITDNIQKGIRYYVTRPGDTLVSIAVEYSTDWASIYNANRDTIGTDPGAIGSGKRLVIPYD